MTSIASGNLSGGIVTPSSGNFLNFFLSSSASENPTLSIIPLSGKDFTQRIITPVSENSFAKLGYQDFPISIIMRLMASSIQAEDKKNGSSSVSFMRNDINYLEEYATFRRFVMQLESLQIENKLFVSNLIFDKVILDGVKDPWVTRGDSLGMIEAVKGGLIWSHNDDGTYKMMKRTIGRVLISNYDPRSLTNEKLYDLNETANHRPDNYVLMDIREGYPGGEIPLFGTIKLRSFFHILKAVSNGVGGRQHDLQIDIAPDPRTLREIEHNPRQTMTINVSDTAPSSDILNVHYKGRYYSVGDSTWDRTAFMLLKSLFQMTVTDISDAGIPINISK